MINDDTWWYMSTLVFIIYLLFIFIYHYNIYIWYMVYKLTWLWHIAFPSKTWRTWPSNMGIWAMRTGEFSIKKNWDLSTRSIRSITFSCSYLFIHICRNIFLSLAQPLAGFPSNPCGFVPQLLCSDPSDNRTSLYTLTTQPYRTISTRFPHLFQYLALHAKWLFTNL